VITLFGVEVRRCLARRLTWVLVGLALLGTAAAAVLIYVNTEDEDEARATAAAERRAFVEECVAHFGLPGTEAERRATCEEAQLQSTDTVALTDLWASDDTGDSILGVTTIFLVIAALLAGASTVGAEWRAGTITTLLTWEPRRVRVALAKVLAAALVAALIALVLQLVFAAALLPTLVGKGTTAGADADWYRAAAGGLARGLALVALAGAVGASIAMIGRNTAAALGAAFAYLVVFENIVRAWRPRYARWLIGDNAAAFLTGKEIEGLEYVRSFGLATTTLLAYVAAVVAVAVVLFRTRDIAGTG
jgi:ABC-2 type transport system permease protein